MNEQIKKLAEQCWNERPEGQLHFDNEKFAELIVRECVSRCGSQADQRNLLKAFGFEVESNIKYAGPERNWSINSQYDREYNLPAGVTNNGVK